MNRFNFSGSWRPRLWPINLVFISALACANGTPIARSDVGATGNIRPMKHLDVELRRETLQIAIDGDWGVVRAEYHLIHHGATNSGATTVAYGFPIDHVNPAWCEDCDDVSEEDKIKAGKPIRDIRIDANGKELATSEIAESKPDPAGTQPEFLRSWILTELPFKKDEQSVVTVSYRVRNWLNDWIWTTNFDPEYSVRKFRYQLSPSGNWGDGKVRQLDISIDVAKLTQSGGKVTKIAPAGYTQEKNLLRWQFADVDLEKLPDIELEYDDNARLLSQFVAESRLSAAVIRTQASSTLESPADPGRHDLARVLDGDLDTAWCEGATGDGVGQTLRFDFAPSVAVTGIGIVNGYTKNRALYVGNGRVRDLSVESSQQEYGKTVTTKSSASLPSRTFEQLNRHAIAQFTDWIADFGSGDETHHVTLTIDAAVPGEKHPDTCISEIYFVGY